MPQNEGHGTPSNIMVRIHADLDTEEFWLIESDANQQFQAESAYEIESTPYVVMAMKLDELESSQQY